MSDLISRQMAIDAIEAKEANEFGNYMDYNVAFNDGLRSAVFALEELPSAQKKGEWIYDPNDYDDNTWECSVCKEPWTLIEGTPPDNNMNYCPNCGADMRGEENE